MTGWADGPLLAYDSESTGKEPFEARIVTAAAVFIGPASAGPRTVESKSWLINPGVEIPAEATAIHGITNEQAALGEQPGPALVEIAAALEKAWHDGMPVIGFNLSYDLTLLDCELARHNHPPLGVGHCIDPLVIDRAVDKYRKGKRTLDVTCTHYRVSLDGAHEAGADAIAAARLAWRLAAVFPALVGELSLAELHEHQVEWQQSWATHFQEYQRTRGGVPDAVIDGSWPLRAADRAERAVA